MSNLLEKPSKNSLEFIKIVGIFFVTLGNTLKLLGPPSQIDTLHLGFRSFSRQSKYIIKYDQKYITHCIHEQFNVIILSGGLIYSDSSMFYALKQL